MVGSLRELRDASPPVRFITTFIRPNTWVALSTKDGGEVANADN